MQDGFKYDSFKSILVYNHKLLMRHREFSAHTISCEHKPEKVSDGNTLSVLNILSCAFNLGIVRHGVSYITNC